MHKQTKLNIKNYYKRKGNGNNKVFFALYPNENI